MLRTRVRDDHMVMTTTQIESKLEDLAALVYEADEAWAADLENAELKAAYKAAKKTYREMERKALDAGALGTCQRCGGEGGWKGWPGFTCFKCGGSGLEPLKARKFQAEPTTRAKRAAAWDAEIAEQDRVYSEQIAVLGPVGDALVAALAEIDAFSESDDYYAKRPARSTFFLADLALKLRRYGSLSEKQIDAARGVIARNAEQAEQKAAAGPLAEGRYEIVGEIISGKYVDSQYGSTYKILVKLENGNRVYGTCPRAIDGNPGDVVKITATVEQSRDDEHFGFFSRPTVKDEA